jgi:hypothetical protein
MRLMIMMLVLIGVVVGMMQCAKRTMVHKKPHPEGRAPSLPLYLAGRG